MVGFKVYPLALVFGAAMWGAIFVVETTPKNAWGMLSLAIAGSLLLGFGLRLKWRRP